MEADLQPLVCEELAPYMGDDARAWIGGRSLALTPVAAQSLAMIVHELATNAAKYGALSVPDGRVHVDWEVKSGDVLVLRWKEDGGPATQRPSKRGVGASVIARAANQLEGTVEYEWERDGLVFLFRGPAKKIVRRLEAT